MKSKLAINGICVLLGGIVFAGIPLLNGSVPAREQLVEVSGPVASLTPSTSGKNGLPVRFSLRGDDRTFQYLSIGKEMLLVEESLKGADQEIIRVLIDPKDDFAYPTAYEVRVGERTIRPYSDVSAAFDRNNQIGLWIGEILTAAGLLMLAIAAVKRRR